RDGTAHKHDHPPAGGVEKAAIFDGRLAAADDNHSFAGLVVERLDKRSVVMHALEIAARHLQANWPGAKSQHQSACFENLTANFDRVGIKDPSRSVQHELDIELLF